MIEYSQGSRQSQALEGGLAKSGLLIVGLDGVKMDSVDALHQLLDRSRIGRDCVIRFVRDAREPKQVYLSVRPLERLGWADIATANIRKRMATG